MDACCNALGLDGSMGGLAVRDLSIVMVGLEAVRRNMAVQLVLFVLRIVPIPVGAFLGSADIAVIGVSVASVAGYIIYLVAICSVMGLTIWSILVALAGPIAFSLVCSVLVLELTQYLSAGYVVFLVSTVVWLLRVRVLVLKNLMK